MLALALVAAAHAATPVPCIVTLGDSITQAGGTYLSWRYPFWEALVADGYDFDMVGSIDVNWDGVTPSYPDAAFDPDHEGHSGWRADQILAQLPGWTGAYGYTPDLAIIHLGTNDIGRGQPNGTTLAELRGIITVLRSVNPDVTILVAQIIPTKWIATNRTIQNLNLGIGGLTALSTTRSPVVVVDQYTGYDGRLDNFDGLHPNTSGEDKLADNFYAATVANWPTGHSCLK